MMVSTHIRHILTLYQRHFGVESVLTHRFSDISRMIKVKQIFYPRLFLSLSSL